MPLQHELAGWLGQAAAESSGRRGAYRTEYLGYLPFGQYDRVAVGVKGAPYGRPESWEFRDLEPLADAGILVRVLHWQNRKDERETESQYDVVANEVKPTAVPDTDRNHCL